MDRDPLHVIRERFDEEPEWPEKSDIVLMMEESNQEPRNTGNSNN